MADLFPFFDDLAYQLVVAVEVLRLRFPRKGFPSTTHTVDKHMSRLGFPDWPVDSYGTSLYEHAYYSKVKAINTLLTSDKIARVSCTNIRILQGFNVEIIRPMKATWFRPTPTLPDQRRASNVNGGVRAQARLDFFYDIQLRAQLADDTFFELRRLWYPLRPWGADGDVITVNPNLPTFFTKGCIPNFRADNFLNASTPMPNSNTGPLVTFWCEEHVTYVHSRLTTAIRYQLGCGLITAANYETIISLSGAPGPFTTIASHLCHNGSWCTGLTCVFYEAQSHNVSQNDDMFRVDKLSPAEKTDPAKLSCRCWPGQSTPHQCLLGRHVAKPQEVRDRFIALLEDNRDGQRKCPMCPFQIKVSVMPTVYNGRPRVLDGSRTYAIDKKLTKPLEDAHGYKNNDLFTLH